MRTRLRRTTAALVAAALVAFAGTTLAGCRPTPTIPASEASEASEASDGSSTGDGMGVGSAERMSDAGATLAVTEAESSVSGHLPPGAVGPLSITLRSRDGTLRAIASAGIDGRGGAWSTVLLDGQGGDVAPAGGDRLHLTDRGRAYDWTIPDVALHFGRGTDTVSGTTAAGALLDVAVTGARQGIADGGLPPAQAAYARTTSLPSGDAATAPPPTTARSIAGADGSFVIHLGAGVALRGDDEVKTTVTVGGVRLHAPRRVPFLRVSLHPGDVTAFVRPNALVTVTLRGADGEVRAAGSGIADYAGRATVWAHDAAFRRTPARPGDVVEVTDGETNLRLRVPAFHAVHDLEHGTLAGIGHAGGALDITLWNPWYPGEIDEPRSTVGADGRWSVTPEVALHPASHYYITNHFPDGDRIFYCYQIPMLHVAPGQPVVGVQALYFADAHLELVRAGRTIATGRTTNPWVEIASVVLRDGAGAPVSAQSGDTVRATLDGVPAEVEVGRLTATVEPEDEVVTGTAAPGAVLELMRTSPLGAKTTAGADGGYRFDPAESAWLDGALPRPGIELNVVERLAGGHFRRARLIGPTIEVDIGTRTVTGQAAGGSSVVVRRGTDRATAAADASDRYTATLPAATGVLTGGDVVTLTLGSWSTSLRVLPLAASFDPATGRITGRTAGDLVVLAVWAGDADMPERWTVPVDAVDGPWSVDVTKPGVGVAPIDPARVRRIEATIPIEGHAVRWMWIR